MRWATAQHENPPTGAHVARCVWLVDLGTQQHSFNNETWASRDVKIGWELPEALMEGIYTPEVKGKPFMVSVTIKQSLHPTSKMRKLLKGWRGRDFTPDEIKTFDPKKLLGLGCRVNLVESTNGDYVNVDSVSPLGKKDKLPKQVNQSLYFSLEEAEFDQKVFALLPEGLRKKIATTPEFRALMGDRPSEDEPPMDARELAAEGDGTDSDIPF